jgi:hypothetical protein
MSDFGENSNSLPEEFRQPPVSLSIYRVLLLAMLMGAAVIIVRRVFPESVNSEKIPVAEAASDDQGNDSLNETKKGVDATSRAEDVGTNPLPGQRQNIAKEAFDDEGGSSLEIFNQGQLKKADWHPKRNRAFVSVHVINMRDRPGGKLVGQLLNGEELSVIDWPKGASFLKVGTSFGSSAYVSADLVSSEQFRGVFSNPSVNLLPFDSFVLESAATNPSPEFYREYENFRNLLKGLPAKKSFDYSKSNLKYILVSSTSVIFPAEPAAALRLIRSVTAKPAVFFERSKSKDRGPLDPELEIRANIPVRRVLENGSAKSTRFEKFLLSGGCPKKRMAALTDDGTATESELLIFDINKKVDAKFSAKPHRGNPGFTWAYADLNGDSWQDAAFYFGGETGRAPFRFLFVAHNIDGVWQMHHIDDYSGAEERCLKQK